MRKKLIAFLLMVISLFMLNSCGPSVNAKEWGFENLEDMDNRLIRVYDYNVTGSSDDYVVVSKGWISGYLFKEGNKLKISADIDETTGEIDISELDGGEFENTYEIVDNDNLSISNGLTAICIKERITSEYRNDFVIFEIYMSLVGNSGEYIPYSLIDFTRGLEYVEREEAYKLYLK